MLVFQFLIMRERLASLILNGGRQSKLITRILTDALFFSDTFHPEQAPVTYGQKKAHYRGHINFGCGERGIRTLGTPLRVRRFSKPLVSATHPSHRSVGCFKR